MQPPERASAVKRDLYPTSTRQGVQLLGGVQRAQRPSGVASAPGRGSPLFGSAAAEQSGR